MIAILYTMLSSAIGRRKIRMQGDEAEIIVLHGEGGPERLADAQGVDRMALRAAH